MTTVLLAVDETDESIAAVRQARELFGPDADYLAVNVSDEAPSWAPLPMPWGAVVRRSPIPVLIAGQHVG